MTHLSVNVNKLATLRNSREKNLPDVTALSEKILHYGAHGITVHPRPDGRHIRLPDVKALGALVQRWNRAHGTAAEFNIEGYPSTDFLKLILETRPDQCTLVPDPPEALTSNAGWDLTKNEALLETVLKQLKGVTRVSLFIDPKHFTASDEAALGRLKPGRIELYTETFSDDFSTPAQLATTDHYVVVAEKARNLGIGVNAGHDLNQKNLGSLIEAIPWMDEVSIGHALICESLEDGLEKTVGDYLRILAPK